MMKIKHLLKGFTEAMLKTTMKKKKSNKNIQAEVHKHVSLKYI